MLHLAPDDLHQARRLLPARVLPSLVRKRADQIWSDERHRRHYVAEMEFLLGESPRRDEVEVLARAYCEQQLLRSYLRWHPRAITRQPVRDAAWLTTRRDPGRAVVLSFLHHHRYDGMFASLARAGVGLEVLVLAEALEADAPAAIRQHLRVVRRGGRLIPTVGGTEAVLARMVPGAVVAIASDVPGRTPVEFLGRTVLGSFGAARIATLSNSPVVLVTSHRDGDGSYLQVHQPLEPTDFEGPDALLAEMLRVHGDAVLDWPEALDTPRARWGSIDA